MLRSPLWPDQRPAERRLVARLKHPHPHRQLSARSNACTPQNLEAEHAKALTRLAQSEAAAQRQDSRDHFLLPSDTAVAAKLREQDLLIEKLQGELFYLVSAQVFTSVLPVLAVILGTCTVPIVDS